MSDWFALLKAHGATVADGAIVDFGDPIGELAAARAGSIVAHLSHLGLLQFSGADAVAFLHGQVSSDIRGLGTTQGRYGGYCTPKGRLLANFLLWRDGEGVLMLLSRDVLSGVEKRLRMYVLRSKVTISDATEDFVVIGASGPAAPDTVTAALGTPAPATTFGLARTESGTVAIRIPGDRFIVVANRAEAEGVWTQLAQALQPVGIASWQWLEIVNGLPLVTAAIQDELVPQMANLELVGGVSFDKGCYPGQEIVARSQYLGQVKRRTFRAHIVGSEAPRAGEPLYEGGDATQTAGIIVNAAPSPEGGYDVLAVLQKAAAERGDLHLRAPDGPALRLLPLPYAIP